MSRQGKEQRGRARQHSPQSQGLKISFDPGSGSRVEADIQVLDSSEDGVGVELAVPLVSGSQVTIAGPLIIGDCRTEITARAKVSWCKMVREGNYRAGLAFDHLAGAAHSSHTRVTYSAPPPIVDHYEVMEVNPKASPDTIHRIYRILAQRYHPDNSGSGDEEVFKRLLEAYRVLSNPEARAAYDVQRLASRQTRWRIFEDMQPGRGPEAEKHKRHGILTLLYTQRVNEPEQSGMTIHDIEDLLACPREHLTFSLWYLKENGYIVRSDNGRFSITARGVDQAEEPAPAGLRQDRLLASAK